MALDQAEALHVLHGRAPDLILVDFHLAPGVAGCQGLQAERGIEPVV